MEALTSVGTLSMVEFDRLSTFVYSMNLDVLLRWLLFFGIG